jgi:integrase
MGARVLDDIAFKVMLEQIRADIRPRASVTGRVSRVLVPVQTDARSAEQATLVVKPIAEHLLRFPPLTDVEAEEHRGLVFYGEKCGLVRRHVFHQIWDHACREASVEPIRLEWLRHTGASIAYRATGDMGAVANRLGHTSVRMMDTVYVKVYAEAAREDSLVVPGASHVR